MKDTARKELPFFLQTRSSIQQSTGNIFGSIVSLIATKVFTLHSPKNEELRSMQWKNVDFENRIITIDASVMKGRKFMVPDVEPVVENFSLRFKAQSPKPVSEVCFAGRNDKTNLRERGTARDQTNQLWGSGKAVTDSGMNSARLWTSTEWPADAIEVQLAYNNGSCRRIYNHAQYLDKRKGCNGGRTGLLKRVEWSP